jgi:hypothetical protein
MPNYTNTFTKHLHVSTPTPYTIQGIVSTSPGIQGYAVGEEMAISTTVAAQLGTRVTYMTTLRRGNTQPVVVGETVTVVKS